MVIEEPYGENLVRHYSNRGMQIEQVETGQIYDEAIDISPCPYTYTETDYPIDGDAEITDEEALSIILGGEPE